MLRKVRSSTPAVKYTMPLVTRSAAKRSSPFGETQDHSPPKVKKKEPNLKTKSKVQQEDSSSESDIDDYLTKPEEIDLNSSFFQRVSSSGFDDIENKILSNVKRTLSDSDTDCEESVVSAVHLSNLQSTSSTSLSTESNFQHLHEYTKKLEEAKRSVAEYEARKPQESEATDVTSLLVFGEKQDENREKLVDSFSEDYVTMSDSEKEDWEEVNEEQTATNEIPKEGLQITVALPGVMKQKKGVDLIASMKRRLNRVKKEQQLFIHKVHLLCWIAHGNFVNNVLNDENLLGIALSLVPSQRSFPKERPNISYLEKILDWYCKTVQFVEKADNNSVPIANALQFQMSKKEANSKRNFVFIFICLLRSMGINCRLVLSLQVLPLRPLQSQLCSLSTKEDDKCKSKSSTIQNKKSKTGSVKVDETSYEELKKEDGNVDDKNSVGKSTVTSKAKDKSNKSIRNKNEVKQETNLNRKESKPKAESILKLNSKTVKSAKTAKNDTKSSEAKEEQKTKMKESKAKPKTESNSKLDSKTAKSRKTSKNESKSSETKAEQKAESNLKLDSTVKKSKVDPKSSGSSTKTTSPVEKRQTRSTLSRKLKEKQIAQLDGTNDSDEDIQKLKSNLKKVKRTQSVRCRSSDVRKTNPDSEDEFETKNLPPIKRSQSSSPVKKTTNIKKLVQFKKEEAPTRKATLDVRNDIINLVKGRIKQQRQIEKRKIVKKSKAPSEDDSDSDYCPEAIKKKQHDSDDEFIAKLKPKVKKRVQVDRRVFSSDSESENYVTKKGIDVWLEVFLEGEEKWISVDVFKKKVHCVKELYSRASHPVSYILGWTSEGYVKDITSRYCPNWNTVTRKLRIDQKWWEETLRPFLGPKTAKDREEDEDLARQQQEQPLPTTISEYKNHPLYVLKRHLLKFEALYPPDLVPLGYVRNEPVYPRQNVYTLHSREIWVKQAKVVKPGETPYKIVKARPKYDKLSNTVITDQPLEIFGPWQVGEYIPPTAENGIVPRNAYGNVELFKACMLPKGTVHLQLPGLNKVARKLNIDCAPAVVGFDYHSGGSHPTFDGFVVCEEFSEQLVNTYLVEQEEAEKRAQEKNEKRIYDNWKKLIKGLLVRERLKARYDFGNTNEKGKKTSKGVLVKKRRICSDDESD